MSWTAYKKRLRPGAVLALNNLRRPWLSRRVEVVQRSKRSILVRSVDTHDLSRIHLPMAKYTRMVDDNDVEILTEKDGPRFLTPDKQLDDEILAGTPWLIMRVVEDAS